MKKVGFISDLHLGLTTDDLDRTNEIINVCFDFVKYVVKKKLDCVVIGGDIFHHNTPSEFLIGQFLRILNALQKYKIKTYVLVGNHDSISSEERKSCLDFINKLTFYPDIKLISDIKCFKMYDTDIGQVYFTFLPHITKSHYINTKYKNAQEYIDGKVNKIFEKVGIGNHNIVFSHLNVKGVIPTVEKNFLKKSTVFLSDTLVSGKINDNIFPLIIQGHIHSKKVIDNVNIVGSPIFVTFGEKDDDKYFSVVNIPDSFGEKTKVDFIKTKAVRFSEYDFDFTKFKNKMLDDKFLLRTFNDSEFLDEVKNKIVKINIKVNEECANINWNDALLKVKENCVHLKPVNPTVIRKKIKRDENQKIDLSPIDSVKVWFQKNKTKNLKEKYSLAKSIIRECNENL